MGRFILMTRLLRETAVEYQRRWQEVYEAEIEEIMETPLAAKFRQLSVLVGSGKLFPWGPDFTPEDAEALNRWNQLRRHYGGAPPGLA
jgi:hypothetical protein